MKYVKIDHLAILSTCYLPLEGGNVGPPLILWYFGGRLGITILYLTGTTDGTEEGNSAIFQNLVANGLKIVFHIFVCGKHNTQQYKNN